MSEEPALRGDSSDHTQFVPKSELGGGLPAKLMVIQGPDTGTVVAIEGAEVCFGRHPDNQLVLDSQMVSRKHGRVVREGDRYFVEDLRSRNGILVNGRKIASGARHSIQHKDVLQLSDCQLLFLHGEGQDDVQRLATIHLDQSMIGREADELLKKFLNRSTEQGS